MEFSRHEQKMTPEERAIHEKQAAEATKLFFEGVEEKGAGAGARWVQDPGSKYPRLHITDKQYKRILREMTDKKKWAQAADRLISEIESQAQETRDMQPSQREKLPTVDEEEFKKRLAEKGRYRGYVTIKYLSGERVTEFVDIQRVRIAQDTVLEVTGTSPRRLETPVDVVGYTVELAVNAPGLYLGKQWLGTFSFVPEFATLEFNVKQIAGDFLCSLWQKKLAELYKEYGGRYDPAMYDAMRPDGAISREVQEEVRRFITRFLQKRVGKGYLAQIGGEE